MLCYTSPICLGSWKTWSSLEPIQLPSPGPVYLGALASRKWLSPLLHLAGQLALLTRSEWGQQSRQSGSTKPIRERIRKKLVLHRECRLQLCGIWSIPLNQQTDTPLTPPFRQKMFVTQLHRWGLYIRQAVSINYLESFASTCEEAQRASFRTRREWGFRELQDLICLSVDSQVGINESALI